MPFRLTNSNGPTGREAVTKNTTSVIAQFQHELCALETLAGIKYRPGRGTFRGNAEFYSVGNDGVEKSVHLTVQVVAAALECGDLFRAVASVMSDPELLSAVVHNDSIRIVRAGGTPKTLEDFLEENPEITTGW